MSEGCGGGLEEVREQEEAPSAGCHRALRRMRKAAHVSASVVVLRVADTGVTH